MPKLYLIIPLILLQLPKIFHFTEIPTESEQLNEFLTNSNETILENSTNLTKPYLIDDYCNIEQSTITINFFREISSYFEIKPDNNNNLNNTCFFLSDLFQNYYSKFAKIDMSNRGTLVYYECPLCNKMFKTNSLLYLHYKLFHLKHNESNICPADFCLSINCNRYFGYFNVKKYSTNPQAVKFNRQPLVKDEECTEDLIFFYKTNCMKLIENCFLDDREKYYIYYKYICNKITCEKKEETTQLKKEGNIGDVFRYIFMYIFGIMGFIYLIIVWLSKYAE